MNQNQAAKPRNVLTVSCGAHIIQDGLVALQYVLLPLLAQTLGLSYAQVGFLRALFYKDLALACEQTSSIFIGGEKSADSENAMINAFGGIDKAPPALSAKADIQRQKVQNASVLFNWRAFPAYTD